MKENLQKKRNKKGFTLAELLIVVAIVAVLAAIAFPVFSAQLKKAQAGADLANLRSAISVVSTELLNNTTMAASTTAAERDVDAILKRALGDPLPKPQYGEATGTFIIKFVEDSTTKKVTGVDTAASTFGGKKVSELITAAQGS